MKIERLLEIIIFLLNNESVTARQLSERYSVSRRTIQRDIDSISFAGVPIISNVGKQGGYSILPSYKIENNFIKKEDFRLIIMALKSLGTGYDSNKLDGIINKYLSLTKENLPNIYVDYGVVKENSQVQIYNQLLEQAILQNKQIYFKYRNVHGVETQRILHPFALKFKWYA